MAKYGKYKSGNFTMTKKMTISLEENLIDELNFLAGEIGKKKTQVVREVLQDYLDINALTTTAQEYKIGMLETVSHKDVREKLGL
jgi:metal-responsive CopG/Arc/MetJ family transcriptional regulator